MSTVVNYWRTQLRSDGDKSTPSNPVALLSIRKSSRIDWAIRFITLTLPGLFLATVVFQPWVDPKWMFLDPLTAAELSGDCCHSHYGFVSTTGVILWAATAAISLFTAAVLAMSGVRSRLVAFPLFAGLLTGWVTLDDALLLHETVLPAFGIPQNAIIALYVLLALSYVAISFRNILRHDFWLLAMGACGLAVSIAVDVAFHSLNPLLVLLEDSAKFFGIFCWAAFHITAFATLLKDHQQGSLNG